MSEEKKRAVTENTEESDFDTTDRQTDKYEIPEEQSPVYDAIDVAIKKPLASTIGKVLLVSLIVFSIIIFIASFIRYRELKSDIDALKKDIAAKEDSIEEKEYLIDVPLDDKDYIIRTVREKLGLFLPDAIVYYSDLND